jgi:hypothetical protein
MAGRHGPRRGVANGVRLAIEAQARMLHAGFFCSWGARSARSEVLS